MMPNPKRSLADKVVAAINKKTGNSTARVAATPGPPVIERCEKCRRPMVICAGPYGPFWGCSGFPKCRGKRGQKRPLSRPRPVARKGKL